MTQLDSKICKPDCFFTICTKSYLGLAEALGLSMRDQGVTGDFMILVVDHNVPDTHTKSGRCVSAQEFCGYSDVDWESRTFKYDLVELCTSIKARAFRVVFDIGYRKAIYFDPDVLAFDDLSGILGALDHHDVIATPHRMSLGSDIPARGGVFNLGFLAVRHGPQADRLLTWWDNRLEDYSINDPMRGYFTDQKWMDHLPVLLRNGRLLITDHPGMNLAPFNLNERQLKKEGNTWCARLTDPGNEWRPLCFVHFSAFDYRALAVGKDQPKAQMAEETLPGFRALLAILTSYLRRGKFLDYSSIPYEYATFSNDSPVLPGHRRIYHSLIAAGKVYSNPFDENATLHGQFKRAGLIVPAGQVTRGRPDENVRNTKVLKAARVLDLISRMMVRLLGFPRYSELCKFLVRYYHPSNQVRLLRIRKDDIKFRYF